MTRRARSRANGEGSIYPYKNGYAAYAWVNRPGGRRSRKYVYGKTRTEVYDKWLKLQQQAAAGLVVAKASSVEAYVSYWLTEIVKPNLAPKTAETYEMFARLYIIPGLGSKSLARLSSRDVQTWINQVARACQCCAQGKDASRGTGRQRCCAAGDCCQKRLSPRSLKNIRDCLRAVLNCAAKDGMVAQNVAEVTRIPSVRKRRRARWSTEEARRFLASAREDDDPLYAAYVLVVVEGMRRGEVLGLPVDAVDFEQQVLDIRYQLQRVDHQLLHRDTKTELSEVKLPFPTIVGSALQLRLTRRDHGEGVAAEAWQDCGLMFTTRYGTPIEPRNFNRSWDARIRKAGVPRITVHDGRRTCGSLLADLDVHPRVAMAILRHAQIAITMEIYTEVSDAATRAGLRKLGESLE